MWAFGCGDDDDSVTEAAWYRMGVRIWLVIRVGCHRRQSGVRVPFLQWVKLTVPVRMTHEPSLRVYGPLGIVLFRQLQSGKL